MFTKQMIQALMVLVAMFATIASTPKASADFALTRMDIDVNQHSVPSAGGVLVGPPIVDKNDIQSVSRTFTNTYSFSGDPTGNGNLIRTIVVGRLDSISPGAIPSPVSGPDANPSALTFIAVVDGTLGANNTVSYDTGRVGVFETINPFTNFPANTPGVFNDLDPSTWGFGTAVAPGSVAEWKIAPPQDIVVDTGLPLISPVTASTVNTSSVDTLTGNLLTEGRFLFIEDSPAGATPGDAFIEVLNNLNVALNDVSHQPALNPGDPSLINTTISAEDIIGEGIFLDAADTLESTTADDVAMDFAAADLDILNAIGLWGTTDDVNVNGVAVDGGAVNGFATAFAAPLTFGGLPANNVTDYSPNFNAQNISISGDFTATGDIDVRSGVFVGVPEPTTAVLGLMGLAGIGFRRRRNA